MEKADLNETPSWSHSCKFNIPPINVSNSANAFHVIQCARVLTWLAYSQSFDLIVFGGANNVIEWQMWLLSFEWKTEQHILRRILAGILFWQIPVCVYLLLIVVKYLQCERRSLDDPATTVYSTTVHHIYNLLTVWKMGGWSFYNTSILVVFILRKCSFWRKLYVDLLYTTMYTKMDCQLFLVSPTHSLKGNFSLIFWEHPNFDNI